MFFFNMGNVLFTGSIAFIIEKKKILVANKTINMRFGGFGGFGEFFVSYNKLR